MHMFASVHEVIEQKYFANSQWILFKQIGNLLTLKTQNQVGLPADIGGERGGRMGIRVNAVVLQQIDNHRISGMRGIVQSTRAAHGDIAALQANSSVGKLGSGVVFGHHGTALIAGAYIHDLHNNVPSQVL